MDNYNVLTAAETERLALIAEGCADVQKIVAKIMRHGYSEYNPLEEKITTNRELLARAIGDLCWANVMAIKSGDITQEMIWENAKSRHKRVKKYLHHNEPVSL